MNELEELEEILSPLYKQADYRRLNAIDEIKDLVMRLKNEKTALKEAAEMNCSLRRV